MRKNFSNIIFISLLLIIKTNISNSFDNMDKIEIFEKKLQISTKISFSENNTINWLTEFKKISQDNNQNLYMLENNLIKVDRIITRYENKVIIEDRYSNKTDSTIGVATNYKFLNFLASSVITSGSNIGDYKKNIIAENPSILINNKEVSLGIYINDTFSKIHSQINIDNNNFLNIYNDNLIIKPKGEYTKSFTIYKYNKIIQYYEFINYLRKELNVYSYLDGNLFWLDTYINRKILDDEIRFKNFVKNYGIKYFIITPWLDYDNYNHLKNEKWSRTEFAKYLKKIKKKINKIDPQIKLLIALQSNVVSIDERIQKIIKDNKSNKVQSGFHHYNIDFKKLINLGFEKEELIFDQNNRILFETYYQDWKYKQTKNNEEIALALKAIYGGHLYNKLVEQVNFVLDEIQFDGIYIDQFNQHYISSKHKISFNEKYANIGKLDEKTGKILKKFENVTLNTSEFKEKIIDYALMKTNYVFFNSHHINDNFRKKPVTRFFEGFWYFWADKMWKEDSRDFFSAKTYFGSHLSTPVSLSLSFLQPGDWQLNPHSALVKNLRFCIYNGNLMYFLEQDIKKLNTDKEKKNVFSKLYPIQVKEIHQGKIIGKKKIISIVDLKIEKEKFENYNYYYFDKEGYIMKNRKHNLTNLDNVIIVHLDKDEILIVEKK